MELTDSQVQEKRGFSLLEIISALAIIAIIMTLLAIGGLRWLPFSRTSRAQTDIVHIQEALEAYQLKFGEYPREVMVGAGTPSMEVILFNALTGNLAPNGKLGNFPTFLDRSALEFENGNFPVIGGTPTLVTNTILDPWGNSFRYRYDPDDANWENFNYVLFSAGPDGVFAEVTTEGQKNEGHVNNVDNIYAE